MLINTLRENIALTEKVRQNAALVKIVLILTGKEDPLKPARRIGFGTNED